MFCIQTTRYCIVNGNFPHEAILFLTDIYPLGKQFRWILTVVKSGIPNEHYPQLPRSQNKRHSPELYVKLTFADIPYNLQMEKEHLKQKEGRFIAAMVAQAFTSNGNCEWYPIKETAQKTMRIRMSVINTINELPVLKILRFE